MPRFAAGDELAISFARLFEDKWNEGEAISVNRAYCAYGCVLCAERGDIIDFDGAGFVFIPASDPSVNVYTPAVCKVLSIDEDGTATLSVKSDGIEIKMIESELACCATLVSKE